MAGKIKKPDALKGKRIAISENVNYDAMPPIFSLERLQPGDYCLSSMDQENKSQFAEAIFRRKSLKWSEVKNIGRHGLGLEKIPKHAIKAPLPSFIKDDIEDFFAFRFNGKRPMVGYRVNNIFYVLWFDHNFTLYKH